jgi:mono/diheme cytochrome c family protein
MEVSPPEAVAFMILSFAKGYLMRFAIGLLIAAALHAAPGEMLYNTHCNFCHGAGGEGGRGPALNRRVLRQAPDDAALRRIIRRGIAGTDMPGTSFSEAELNDVAAYVRTLGQKVTPAALPGDAQKGASLYARLRCAGCHPGNAPDLEGVGERRSAAFLRQSVTDPDAAVPRDYVLLSVTPRGREALQGVRVDEDTFSVILRDGAGKLHSFWKSELERLEVRLGKSAMPAYPLSASDLDDIVAYLAGGTK